MIQNPEDVDTLRRLHVPERKLHLLGNGIDLSRFDPERVGSARRDSVRAQAGAGPDDVLCGLVGRLVWEKGYREVFAAAAALRTRVPNLRFFVAGPSDEAKGDAVTPADIRAAELAGVTFLGMRDDVEELYAAMDIYVLASHREGWPRSAMEAAAMGVPVDRDRHPRLPSGRRLGSHRLARAAPRPRPPRRRDRAVGVRCRLRAPRWAGRHAGRPAPSSTNGA